MILLERRKLREAIKVRDDKGLDPKIVKEVKDYVAFCKKNGVPMFSEDYPGMKSKTNKLLNDNNLKAYTSKDGNYELSHEKGTIVITNR